MDSWALIAYGLAAAIGAVMAARHFQGKTIPAELPVSHGVLAGAGSVLLLVFLLQAERPSVAWLALGFFAAAAAAGLIVLRRYLQKKPLRSGMIIVHAMLAALGLIYLASFLFASSAID